VIASLCALTLALPGDWAQFRGPAGRGVADGEAHLPVAFGPEQNVLWRAPTPAGDSSPCVAAGRVFLTGFAGEGEDATLMTLCFDRASGAELWRRTLSVPQFERTYAHGPATPTPACDGERVFAAFGSFGLVAYDLDGQELWRKPLPVAQNTFGTASSPLVAGGRLIFVRDEDEGSFLEAVDPANGTRLWRVDRTGFGSGWSTPGVWQTASTPQKQPPASTAVRRPPPCGGARSRTGAGRKTTRSSSDSGSIGL
jgi:outer membrane protein assembly factor BamB